MIYTQRFNVSNYNHIFTLIGMDEKLKRDNNDKLANEQIYRSLTGSFIYLTITRPDIVLV